MSRLLVPSPFSVSAGVLAGDPGGGGPGPDPSEVWHTVLSALFTDGNSNQTATGNGGRINRQRVLRSWMTFPTPPAGHVFVPQQARFTFLGGTSGGGTVSAIGLGIRDMTHAMPTNDSVNAVAALTQAFFEVEDDDPSPTWTIPGGIIESPWTLPIDVSTWNGTDDLVVGFHWSGGGHVRQYSGGTGGLTPATSPNGLRRSNGNAISEGTAQEAALAAIPLVTAATGVNHTVEGAPARLQLRGIFVLED